MRTLRDVFIFQIVWLVAAFGAARGASWPAVAAATVAVATHLASSADRATLLMIAATGAWGLLGETAMVVAGVLRYSAPWPTDQFAPAWILALWLAFATTLPASKRALGSFPLLVQCGLGAALGPLSYIAGERIGALTLSTPRWVSLAALTTLWGCSFPALIALATWLETSKTQKGAATRR